MKTGEVFSPHSIMTPAATLIPHCVMRYRGISASAKLLLACMIRHVDADGKCCISQEALAKEIGLTRRRVIDIIKELVAHGFIKQVRPKGAERLRHQVACYYFLWHACFDDAQNF